MEFFKYTLIVAFDETLTDEEIQNQKVILQELIGDTYIQELGWFNLNQRCRNKLKKWVDRAFFLQLDFNQEINFIEKLPKSLQNLEIEPLKFLILNNKTQGLKENWKGKILI